MSNKDNKLSTLRQLFDKNYYQLLEITPSASAKEIRKAYQKMKFIYGPDSLASYSLFTAEDLERVIKRLKGAFLTLTDLKKRKEYDSSLLEKRQIAKRDIIDYKKLKKEIRAAGNGAVPEEIDEELVLEPGLVYDGKFLKKLRQLKKISLDEIAKITKISPNLLTALENMDSSLLPERIYLKGFLIEYAKCLKLNPEVVSNSYLQVYYKIKGFKKE